MDSGILPRHGHRLLAGRKPLHLHQFGPHRHGDGGFIGRRVVVLITKRRIFQYIKGSKADQAVPLLHLLFQGGKLIQAGPTDQTKTYQISGGQATQEKILDFLLAQR